MESKIQADIEVPVFRPKEEDCQNFREYIERIEKDNNFAKVFCISDSYFFLFFYCCIIVHHCFLMFSIVNEVRCFLFGTNHSMLFLMKCFIYCRK